MKSRTLATVGAALITAFPTVLYTPSAAHFVAQSQPLFLAWLASFPIGFALACIGAAPR